MDTVYRRCEVRLPRHRHVGIFRFFCFVLCHNLYQFVLLIPEFVSPEISPRKVDFTGAGNVILCTNYCAINSIKKSTNSNNAMPE